MADFGTKTTTTNLAAVTPKAGLSRFAVPKLTIILVIAWIVALVPFLFFRETWFSRPLSDQQVGEYLHSDHKPDQIQYALSQIGQRMSRHDASVTIWYPDLLRLCSHRSEDVRIEDAEAMSNDPSRGDFHEALLRMLRDQSRAVRLRAALALVRFGDDAGHKEIVDSLAPWALETDSDGRVNYLARVGSSVRRGAVIAEVMTPAGSATFRTPVSGRVQYVSVRVNDPISKGTELLSIAPNAQQVMASLVALYQIGLPEDLPIIAGFQQLLPDMPQRVTQQAVLTERAIRERAK